MIYLSADLHLFHARIIEYCQRPFTDVEHMNRELIARHNAVVRPEDETWQLGDFCFKERFVPEILKQMNGTKYLVCGNHCPPFVSHKHKNHEAAKQRYLSYGFAGVYQEVHNFHGFKLAHLPYFDDERHGQKYTKYCPKDDGITFLLHGHQHRKPETRIRIRERMIDVGVDGNNYYPISLDELKAIRDKGQENK